MEDPAINAINSRRLTPQSKWLPGIVKIVFGKLFIQTLHETRWYNTRKTLAVYFFLVVALIA